MRIGLTGTVSVGKTTLIKELSKLDYFSDYYIATERSKYLRDLGIPLNTDSTLNGQIVFLAERASELLRDNLLTDRTIIDVMAFTSNSKSMNFKSKENFEELAKLLLSQYDYIFYIPTEGVEIEDNGVRETNSEYRDTIDRSIKTYLKGYSDRLSRVINIPPNLSTQQRVDFIMSNLS